MPEKTTHGFLLDWTPADPRGRFDALRAAFEASERAIAHQADQFFVREQAARRRLGATDQDEWDDFQVFCRDAEDTFAKVFRGGFLISTWAVFESCVKDVGEYIRRKHELPFGLQDLRAGDFIKQCEKFFESTLNLSFVPEKGTRKRLELFRNFRNLLVHHDGSFVEASHEFQNASEIAIRITDYHHDYLTPTAEYNQQSLELVAEISQSLADSVYAILKSKRRAV